VEVLEIHDHINKELSKSEAYIDNFYFCPHHPDIGYPEENINYKRKCECRKPNPGMIFNALVDYEIKPEFCWLVGDSFRDIEAANRAKIRSILISHDLDTNKVVNNFDLHYHENYDLLSGVNRILNDNF
jgi:HAD superfamily hydrolase (TIGR01662 family)